MSKKLFHARGQRDAALGLFISEHAMMTLPEWAMNAYQSGYQGRMFARANLSIGQYINCLETDNFYSDPVEIKAFDTRAVFMERDDAGNWRERT